MKLVYFIQDPRGGEVKIGLTRRASLQRRLKLFQLGSPAELRLLGVIPARNANALLRELHAAFGDARVRGDWFKPIPELMKYIRSRAVEP